MGNKSSNGSVSTICESDIMALRNTPLTALSKRTMLKLSKLLNSKKKSKSEGGNDNNWQNLAYLAQQRNLYVENLSNPKQKTAKLIEEWCKNRPSTATFAHLVRYLAITECSDDIKGNLIEDSKNYQRKQQQQSLDAKSDDTVIEKETLDSYLDSKVVTEDDISRAAKGLPLEIFHALVLSAEKDSNRVFEMLLNLDNNSKMPVKMCIKSRDILPDVQGDHKALMQFIEQRCKHLIIILTDEFLKSAENVFLMNYIQTMEANQKKANIITISYESSSKVPQNLKKYNTMFYESRSKAASNLWPNLWFIIGNKRKISERNVEFMKMSFTKDSWVERNDCANNGENKKPKRMLNTESSALNENGKFSIEDLKNTFCCCSSDLTND